MRKLGDILKDVIKDLKIKVEYNNMKNKEQKNKIKTIFKRINK